MKHIKKPYLPKKKVSVFIADTKIENAVVISPPSIDILPESMRRHADLGIVIVSEKKAVCPPETCAYYTDKLSPYGFQVIEGKSHIGRHYPEDSAYNVGIVGKKCFLNESVCDTLLYEILISEGYTPVHVKQGYSKCSICPVDENTFITGDKKIAAAGEKEGFEVLLISNEGISLPGFSNGFFGGSCGLGNCSELLVNGNIESIPSGKKIREFLESKNIKLKNLKEGKVVDIGSVIPILTDE